MAPPIERLPLDLTGTSRNNFIPGELHLLDTKERRLVIPGYGAFYGESVVLMDNYTQKPLEHGKHYVFDSLRADITKRTAKGVYGVIVIIDRSVSDSVSLSCQYVGGPYQNHVEDAVQLAQILAGDNRPISIGNITDIPDDFLPSMHYNALSDYYNFDALAHGVERIRMMGELDDRIVMDGVYWNIEKELSDLSQNGAARMAELLSIHKADQNAHPQYLLLSEVDSFLSPIRRPANLVPSSGQTNVVLDVTLKAGKFLSLYRKTQTAVQFQVSTTADFSGTPAIDVTLTGTTDTYHYPSVLTSNKLYYWRCRYTDSDNIQSDWSSPTAFTTMAVSVTQPVVVQPTGGVDTDTETPTILSTSFAVSGDVDTHQSTDWEIWTGPNGTGTKIWESVNNTTSKTSIKLAVGVLTRQTTYYPRVRHRATKYGYSAWSTGASFYAVWPLRPTVMGQAYGGGFWAGDITYGGNTYAIIVAPKSQGEATKQLYTSNAQVNAGDNYDSAANTAVLGTNSPAAVFARSLNIATYTDWQVPSIEVLKVIQQNLHPTGATTPIGFKTGSPEAFSQGIYWSSTTYNWVSNDSYYTNGAPIYETTTTYETAKRAGPEPSCATIINEDGPNDIETIFPPNGTIAGYYRWTCSRWVTTTKIIGYEQIYHQVYTPRYQAWKVSFNTDKTVDYVDKTTSYLVRAVRLYRVA